MRPRARLQAAVKVSALAALVVVLLHVPAAKTAPGDLADLSLSKADDPDPVTAGSTLTYTIQVANLGPQGATGVTVTDRLSNRVEYLSATASSGSCERKGRTITCDIGNLAADPTKANAATVTIQVRPRKAGTVENFATVDSVESDPVEANDRAEASTAVIPPQLVSSCRGVQATLTGTPRSDRLVGTSGPDVIAGLEGNDMIFGLSGRDLICPGSGRDRAGGGPAADQIFGSVGADRLSGGPGPDLVAGNPGSDLLFGNRGRDHLRGGRGSDLCFGGAGFDRIRGCER